MLLESMSHSLPNGGIQGVSATLLECVACVGAEALAADDLADHGCVTASMSYCLHAVWKTV
jgi:hypothetical protein